MKSFGQKYAELSESDFVFDDLSYSISAQLRKEMKRQEMSVSDLAEKMGISVSAMSRLLAPDCNMKLKTLAKLLVALGCEACIRISSEEGRIVHD